MKSNADANYLFQERKRIGLKMKEIRTAKGLTMQQVADGMCISKATVSKIEAGSWNFSIEYVIRFGIFLDFKVELI